MSDYIERIEREMKRMKHGSDDEEDHISNLPSNVLTLILSKLTTKEAVRTGILSNRWKNLWKFVPNISASTSQFNDHRRFMMFMNKVLVHRDKYINLDKVDFEHDQLIHHSDLTLLFNYSLSHNVESLRVHCCMLPTVPRIVLFSQINSDFPYNHLTHLDLSFRTISDAPMLPRTMNFPELVECNLNYLVIQAKSEHTDFAEPFSNCAKMITLSVENCKLQDAECLYVVGHRLKKLTIWNKIFGYPPYQIMIDTPNLIEFGYKGPIRADNSNGLVLDDNLDSLEKLRLEVRCLLIDYDFVAITLCGWLQKFRNVQFIEISSRAVEMLAKIVGLPEARRLNLSNLRTLTIKVDNALPYRVPRRVINYILQDSPTANVITNCTGDGIYMDRYGYFRKN